MVELDHSASGIETLDEFRAENPQAGPDEFDSLDFQGTKRTVKALLNTDQGTLCAYCERKLAAEDGHIDHIKPRRGPGGRSDLTFDYTNLAQSCSDKNSCGSKKKSNLLPIEPRPGCNEHFWLSTDGSINAVGTTTAQRRPAAQTLEILGLNQNPKLHLDRSVWTTDALKILELRGEEAFRLFINKTPYRLILGRLVSRG